MGLVAEVKLVEHFLVGLAPDTLGGPVKNIESVEMGGNYVRVVSDGRVFVRLGYGKGWECYRVENGLELFTGYLNAESETRLEAAIGMRAGPMVLMWNGWVVYGWKDSQHQALGI